MAKKKTKAKKIKKAPFKFPTVIITRKHKVLLGSFLMLLGIALTIAFISFLFNWKYDQDTIGYFTDRNIETKNWLSKFGAEISHFFIYKGFGVASFSLAILTSLTGIYLFFNLNSKSLKNFWFWGILVMIWFSTLFGFFATKNALLGGVIGYETNDFLQDYLGFTGTLLVLIFVMIAYLVIRLNITPELVASYFERTKKEVSQDFEDSKAKEEEILQDFLKKEQEEQTQKANINVQDNASAEAKDVKAETEETSQESTPTPKPEPKSEKIVIEGNEEEGDVSMEVETTVEEEEEVDTLSKKLVKDFGEFDPTLELQNYRFPTIELLKDYNAGGGGITINQEELEENKNNIVNTLKNYKIEIAQIKATVGPTVTLYEIVPEAGVRISKIKNL